jgi:hypothetical protein
MKRNGWLLVGLMGIFLLVVALWSEDAPDPGNVLANLVNKVGQLEKAQAEKNAALEKRIDALEQRVARLEAPLQNAKPGVRGEDAWSKLRLKMTDVEVEQLLGEPTRREDSYRYGRSTHAYQFGTRVRNVYYEVTGRYRKPGSKEVFVTYPNGGWDGNLKDQEREVVGWTGDGIH